MMRPSRLVALPFALLAASAAAQEINPTPSSPQACVGLDSDALRLACYDAAFGRKANAEATAKADATADYADLIARDQQAAKKDGGDKNARGSWFENYDAGIDDAIANAGRGSLLDRRWELAKDSKLGTFQMRGYKPMYLFPAFWTSSVNATPSSPNPRNTVTEPQRLQSTETKFQLSFKTKVAEDIFGDNGDLWTAYTQSSRWQVYNSDESRPFRETNYEPEVMLVFRTNYSVGDWRGRLLGVSLDHQSNGRGDPLSRSWNRIIGSIGFDRGNWALVLRPWWRIPDNGSEGDDNPDIADYMGRGDATLVWHGDDGEEFSLLARHSLRTGDESHGALQIDYSIPISGTLRGHLQIFRGYGESMIDYNHQATYVGLGVSLLEWY